MATRQQADQELDPKFEWQENAANYVLRVHLSGFRKEDFRVQVDGAGRLTVRGQRADGSKHIRLHKVFQLPPTSNLDDISGRFDAGVLNIIVPKRPAPPPATIDDIRKPAKEEEKAETKTTTTTQVQGKDEAKMAEHHKEEISKKPEQPKEGMDKKPEEKKAEQHKEDTNKKPEEDARKKAADEKMKEEKVEAKRSKPDQGEQKTAPPPVRKEEGKPKVVEGPTETKPSQQAADEVVDRDSLLERVRHRAEEDRTKAAAAAAEEAERQKKQSACGGWKERVAGELQGLKGSERLEGVMETVKKNKEVIAAAVAAFSLGLFVSSRLFSRN